MTGKARQTKPQQSNLRILNGIWHVQIKDQNGRRRTLSLQTPDRVEAEGRVGQGLKELRARIREQSLSSMEKVPAQAKVLVWDDLEKEPHEEPAWAVFPEEVIETGITWRDIAQAARERRMRLKGEDYSHSWYKSLDQATQVAKALGLGPEDLNSPTACLRMVRHMEQLKLGRATITNRLSTLASALTGAKKSGIYPSLRHAFGEIDFRSTAGQQHHHQPTEKELEALLAGLPSLPSHHRQLITLLLTTGARVGAATSITQEDLEDGGVWLKGKGKDSYWVPLPEALSKELEGGFTFCSPVRIRVILQELVPGLVPHGLRHLFATLGRKQGVPLDAQARLMDHTLPGSMTQMVYGEWPHHRLREEASKIWEALGL